MEDSPRFQLPVRNAWSAQKAHPAGNRLARLPEAERFFPTWDTLEPSNLVDFLFDAPKRSDENRPLLWLFATDCSDVPMISNLWLQNGTNRPIPTMRISLFSTEIRQSRGVRGGAEDLQYSSMMPGEAVRVESIDTLQDMRLPVALWFEVTLTNGQVVQVAAGPNRWQNLPAILLSS